MSRSLRSRPLTLYEGAPSIPPVPSAEEIPEVPSRSTSNAPITPTSDSKGGPRFKKASQVGSNLKKRLSTRYGDEQRNSRIPMGADMLSSMPSLPPVYAAQNQQHGSAYGGSAYTPSTQPGSGRQALDQAYAQHGFEDEGEDPTSAAAAPLSAAYHIDGYSSAHASTSSNAAGRGVASVHSQANRHLQPGSHVSHRSSGGSPSATTRAKTSSSSRGPPVAWEGSSLKDVLESNRRHGLEDVVDIENLMIRENFDGTEYLRMHLPSTMAPSTFSRSLDATKAAVKSDIKSQVFDHYSDFIAISSQVSALENEMIELKSLLAEWRSMPRALEREDENGKSLVSSVNALSKRNSLLSLQQVYRAQLTSLWEGITNSQKFIPYKPGRHLIAEAPDFVELNSATYRPTSNVALFLLDDLLLVASRKKGRMSTKVKLEAERCFALGEIVVVDLKDSVSSKSGGMDIGGAGGIKDSIKIKRGKETFVYKAERAESKRALLNAFRRVAEELANRKKKESRGALEADQSAAADNRRQSIYAGMSFDKAVSKSRSILPDLAEEDGNGEEGVMKLATERIREERKDPNRWLNDWSDGLAVDIALRRWGDACEKVGKGKAVLSTYTPAELMHPVLSARLATHTAALVSALLLALKSTTLRKSSLVALSAHLSTLGYSSIARQTFLSAREDLLRRRKRSIKYEGDAELYVAELSMVVFGMVRNTSEWFMAAWKETGMASGFVKWALSQIHSFALTFRRQVYGNVHSSMMITAASGPGSTSGLRSGATTPNGTSYDRETARRARRVALESAQQLKDVGLDFGFVLNELLRSEEEQLMMQSTPSSGGGVHNRIEEIQNDEQASSSYRLSTSTSSSHAHTEGSSGGGPTGSSSGGTGSSSRPSMTKSGSSGSITSNSGGGSGSGGSAPVPRRKMSSGSLSSSRSGGVLDRVAQFEPPPSAPAQHPSFSSSPSSRRRGSSSDSNSASGTPAIAVGGTPPLRLNALGRKRSFRSGGAGAAGAPPVPPIPSLTLTLADEASGISHRISSADLPNVTAQEIRRRSRLEMMGGGSSSGGRSRDRDEGLDRVAE